MTRVLSRIDVERFRSIVVERFGLQYEDEKLEYLADVLRQRMELLGSPRFDVYVAHLTKSPNNADEFRALAEQLTVNETFFFRNTDNFRALAEAVLPARIRARSGQKRLRILSAGCASGEEPYSLAAMVREALPDLGSWDVKILGIDVNAAVLAKARHGVYSAWSLRSTSEDAKGRYFRAEGRDFVLDPEIRKMVAFEERNLIATDPSFWRSLGCDLVFCRNVLMYFAPDKARDVVGRIAEALLPGGFLFVGHAETLRGLSQDFHLCHTHDTFYYRLRDGSEPLISTPMSLRPTSARTAETLPVAVESTTSWVDAIQRASERIANLSDARGRTLQEQPQLVASGAATRAPPALRAWDLRLALEAVRQERFSEALDIVGSLPADSQQDPETLLLRAAVLTNNARLDESEEICRKLLALDDLHAGAHYLMALCREHGSDSAGAIEHDQTAIYLDAAFAMPHLHLGLMAKRAGDIPTARREIGQALILLAREDDARVLLFGGGFSRQMLQQLCRTELRATGSEA